MKKTLTSILCLFAVAAFAQTAPEKGDYISIQTAGFPAPVHYIFKSGKVYFGFDPATGKAENTYDQDKAMTKELFDMADKAGMDNIWVLDETKIQTGADVYNYRILEYHKGDKTYRICWDNTHEDDNSKKMNELDGKMGSFW
jgi:hypothetical protein